MKKLLFIITSIIFSFQLQAQSIAEIQGTGDASPYDGQTVTTRGIVTAAFPFAYYIQDGDSVRSGIYVYDQSHTPIIGDSIEITGEVDEYYDLTELKNITEYTTINNDNNLPNPIVLETGALNEDYEGVLIRVEDAVCVTEPNTFNEWKIDDGSGAAVVNDLGYNFVPTLGYIYNISGPLEFSFSEYKINPRFAKDIEEFGVIAIKNGPNQSNITTSGFTLTWETNYNGTTEAEYGLTPELELGELTGTTNVQNHSLDFSGLLAGTPYFINVFTVIDQDTTMTNIRAFSTVSESSGEIKVYFNHTVATEFSTGSEAVVASSIEDTIISYIEKATSTIDIAIYDVESEAIIDALNTADNNGVSIRYITDVDQENAVLDNLNEGIALLRGNSIAIMHDKFIIIDAENSLNSWLVSGSVNHTKANLGWDPNNMICIQDQALARAYRIEFNEMWGSDTNIPDEANAKFGADKTDNTPHNFIIDGNEVELYFSPTDNTTRKIISALNSSQYEIEFNIMVFTENSLGDIISYLNNQGIDVKGIIDYTNYTGDEFDKLLENGVRVLEFQNPDGSEWPNGPVLHHKYALVDYNHADSDPLVITGSHNWSASAETKNDENTLIIHNASIANMFHQEFMQRYYDLLTPVANNDTVFTSVNETLEISFAENDFVHYQVTSTTIEIEQPSIGTFTQIDSSKIEYTPNTDFIGFDTILYRIINDDFTNLKDSAYIIISVLPEGSWNIVANDDSINVIENTEAEGSMAQVNVWKNDENPYQVELGFKFLKQPSNGELSSNFNDSIISYTPNLNFVGIDTIIYSIFARLDTLQTDTANLIITVEEYVGINDLKEFAELKIYPNPAQNIIHINTYSNKISKGTISLYNVSGILVSKQEIEFKLGANYFNFDISTFKNGVYILQLQNDNKIHSKRFIISDL